MRRLVACNYEEGGEGGIHKNNKAGRQRPCNAMLPTKRPVRKLTVTVDL